MTLSSSSVIVLADLALTEESIEKLKHQHKTKTYDPSYEPECTIKLKYRTVETLKELSHYNNSETYDQLVMRLIKSYR
ncbi:MAG: hypothetical protein ACRD8Z_04415, partial [Nitrososphaeraceae archaeon]